MKALCERAANNKAVYKGPTPVRRLRFLASCHSFSHLAVEPFALCKLPLLARGKHKITVFSGIAGQEVICALEKLVPFIET